MLGTEALLREAIDDHLKRIASGSDDEFSEIIFLDDDPDHPDLELDAKRAFRLRELVNDRAKSRGIALPPSFHQRFFALEDLEATLLAADLGPAMTAEVLETVRKAAGSGDVQEAVRQTLRAALPGAAEPPARQSGRPHVIFVVGVNGGGKTTTVGKLAAREKAAGRKPLMVAADTFRAAAVEQLERWSERVDVELVSVDKRVLHRYSLPHGG